MADSRQEADAVYAFDTQAGPVYRTAPVTREQWEKLAVGRETPHVIDVLVWPGPDSAAGEPERRVYYATNLPQAVARAVDVEIRLREQGFKALLVAVRLAETGETELFFGAHETLGPLMPEPVPEKRIMRQQGCVSTDTAVAGYGQAANSPADGGAASDRVGW